jgi:hypothetical protein
MDLIHLPCLLPDTVFGWRIRRENFSPFRAAPLSPRQSLQAKACVTAIAGPETLPVALKTTGRQGSHLSPLIVDGKRIYRLFPTPAGVGTRMNRELKWRFKVIRRD